MVKFRFQDLEKWKLAIEITDQLFDIADNLEQKKFYRFADQLRGSGMSMSNSDKLCRMKTNFKKSLNKII